MSLADRIRAERETWTTVDVDTARGVVSIGFLIRRPTLVQMVRWRNGKDDETIRGSVVGWREIRECDLVAGGGSETPPFDSDALVEWARDRPNVFVALIEAIDKAVREYTSIRSAAEKNESRPGGAEPEEALRNPGRRDQRPDSGRDASSVAHDGKRVAVGGG